jgi:hypothetical protein
MFPDRPKYGPAFVCCAKFWLGGVRSDPKPVTRIDSDASNSGGFCRAKAASCAS